MKGRFPSLRRLVPSRFRLRGRDAEWDGWGHHRLGWKRGAACWVWVLRARHRPLRVASVVTRVGAPRQVRADRPRRHGAVKRDGPRHEVPYHMVESGGLFNYDGAELLHKGAVQEVSDSRVVSELDRRRRPVVLLDRIQVAETLREAESGTWAPQGGDLTGWGMRDLWGDLGRRALPEHDVVQRAFVQRGEWFLRCGRLSPLDSYGAGLGWRRRAPQRRAKEAVVDNSNCPRFVD